MLVYGKTKKNKKNNWLFRIILYAVYLNEEFYINKKVILFFIYVAYIYIYIYIYIYSLFFTNKEDAKLM